MLSRSWVPTSALLLLACGAEVRLEDGGEASSGSVFAVGSGGGAGASTGGGAAAGGEGGGAPYDFVEGCRAMCDRDCTGNPALCAEKCREAVESDLTLACAQEVVALHACRGEACAFVDPDCAAEEEARRFCHDVHSCAGYIYGRTCDADTTADCDCTTGCLDGHVARTVCVDAEDQTYTQDCDCYFDGEIVAQCRAYGTLNGCYSGSSNCCDEFFVR
jgi:hypothetical protein